MADSYHFADMQLQQPWLWFMQITPPWPPDGFILKLVLTVLALDTCFLVVVHGYYRILKAKIYDTTKKLESNDSAASTKRLEVIEQQLIATNSTPTTGPATTSPVPICLPNVPSNSTAMRPPTPPSSPSRKELCTSTLSASTVHAVPTVHYTVSQALSMKEGLSKHLMDEF
jgi:hypothetical protein